MSIDLGEYYTEERAKEVLNEIQDFIVPKVFVPQELRFMSSRGFMAIGIEKLRILKNIK